MLALTDTEWGRWVVVEATDRRWTRAKVFETLVQRLEDALRQRDLPLPEPPPVRADRQEEVEHA
jgi:hypothetical protein